MRKSITAIVAGAFVALCSTALAQQQTVGLFLNTPEAQPGYTLFSPLQSHDTFLIDIGAHPVHRWTTGATPGLMGYLTEDGHLLRAAQLSPAIDPHWTSAIGGGGRIEEYDWDNNLVWSLDWMDATKFQHHDFKKMPNGNVLITSWDWHSHDEAVAAGRNPASTAVGGFWPDGIYEIQPTYPSGGTVVWSWHAWDHYVQEFDNRKANYGVVADHPELLDINTPTDDGQQDNNHVNAVAYNPVLDEIAISSRSFSEIWIIDHSTTTAEAASHSGGLRGHGGDLLYRWGNPAKYGRGTQADRKLFNQHDVQWIAPGLPGENDLLIFNNGIRRQDGSSWSEIVQITPPILPDGNYDLVAGATYGPDTMTWSYPSSPDLSFLSPIIAGVQRQPNGNTLIAEGTTGELFEVAPDGRKVWRYISPIIASGPVTQGTDLSVDPRIPVQNNAIFKMRKYLADYPGLQGHDLTPGEVLEIFDPPPPEPLIKPFKIDTAGTQVRMTWDATTCPAADYNTYYGLLSDVSSYRLQGSLCGVGTSGTSTWSSVPGGNLFMLMVGIGDYPIYESSWGTDSFGVEHNGWVASNACSVTTKSLAVSCP